MQFKISPEGILGFKKKLLLRSLITPVIGVATGVVLELFKFKDEPFGSTTMLLFYIPVFIGVGVFSYFYSLKKLQKTLKSYVLSIDQEIITRQQWNTQTISIAKSEIKKIIKNKNGTFTILGPQSLNMIGVPAGIENSEELEQILSKFHEIKYIVASGIIKKGLTYLSSMVFLASFLVVFISENKWAGLIAGSVVFIGMVIYLVVVQRSKNVPNNLRRNSLFVIIPLFAIIATVFFKFYPETGNNQSQNSGLSDRSHGANDTIYKKPNIDSLLASHDEEMGLMALDQYIAHLCAYGDHMERLSVPQKNLYLNMTFEDDINEGGFDEYFYGFDGKFANETLVSLEAIGALESVNLLKASLGSFSESIVPKNDSEREVTVDNMIHKDSTLWNGFDQKFKSHTEDLTNLNFKYVRENKQYF